jgi:hypothetical protein
VAVGDWLPIEARQRLSKGRGQCLYWSGSRTSVGAGSARASFA